MKYLVRFVWVSTIFNVNNKYDKNTRLRVIHYFNYYLKIYLKKIKWVGST